MPVGEYWFPRSPAFHVLPQDRVYWHIYPERTSEGSKIRPRMANPASKARFALPSSHAMFYLGDTLSGVLWETLLRWIEPASTGEVEIALSTLTGMRAVQLRLTKKGVPWFPLTQPEMRMYGHKPDSDTWQKIQKHLQEPDHAETHAAARDLLLALEARGFTDMPVLSWASRQHQASNVYLAYQPPMGEDWWEVVGKSVPLDDINGHNLIRKCLSENGFTWPEALIYDPAMTPIGPINQD